MNEPVIFHIGLYKTATTFLQDEIFPKLKNINFIRGIFEMHTPLQKDILNLVSAEMLSVHPNRSFFSPFTHGKHEERFVIAERLHACFPDAKIIIGIRNKGTWLKSLYSQYVLAGGTFSFDKYSEQFDARFFEFTTLIDFYKDRFNDVYVYRFEDLVQDSSAFVNSICKFIGRVPPNFINKRTNPSLSKGQLQVYRLLNRFCFCPLHRKGIFPQRVLYKLYYKIK